jgi:hypothetical protein
MDSVVLNLDSFLNYALAISSCGFVFMESLNASHLSGVFELFLFRLAGQKSE